MEALSLIARLDGATAGELISRVNEAVLDPLFPRTDPLADMSLARRALATWMFLYLGGTALYVMFASLDVLVLALVRKWRGKREVDRTGAAKVFVDATNDDYPLVPEQADVRSEFWFSIRSLAVMSALSVPLEIGVQLGYSKVYHYASDYSLAYLLLSPFLFIIASDCAIYLIHRGLHHRYIYRHIHKQHHGYVHTTAFAAFAFHPLDGFCQGVPYQIFVYLFPFHSVTHVVSMAAVLLWTINIHDRASLRLPGVNGAAHHTVHHTTFRSNYGQYLTLWDRIFGTHRDPFAWQLAGAPELSEKEVRPTGRPSRGS
jgi:Delta7-sterol 5-desaturase